MVLGKALRTKIVLTISYNADRSIERYKARLVILGNHQVHGESYEDTYASVRMFINFTAKGDLPPQQLNIMFAFGSRCGIRCRNSYSNQGVSKGVEDRGSK